MGKCEVCGGSGGHFYVRVQFGLLVKACLRCTEQQDKLLLTQHGAFASEIERMEE